MKFVIAYVGFAVMTVFGALETFIVAGQKSETEGSEPGMLFLRHPQPFIAPLEDEIYFECGLNLAAEKFVWSHRPVGSKEWILLPPDNVGGKSSKYIVTFDDVSKAGDYRCIAYYGTSGLASDPARLTQAKIDRFIDKNNVDLRVPAGNNVPITCPVPHSVPEAVIQFFKDGRPIQNASLSKVMLIEKAKPSNSGNYHCEANNYITFETYASHHKTNLIVENNTTDLRPYFIKQPQYEYKVERGKNISLECFAAGFPIPQVMWTKLGSTLPLVSSFTSTGLNLVNVQPVDRGEYDCLWSNRVGRVKSLIILTVGEAPSMLHPPELSIISEGGKLQLTCNATGFPAPIIEWLINGETLLSNKNVEIKGSSLYISPVEKKHAGIVQCVASNEYGSHSGYNYLRVNPKQHLRAKTSGGKESAIAVESSTNIRNRQGSLQGETRKGDERGGVAGAGKGSRRGSKHGKKNEAMMIPPSVPNITRLSETSVMVRWTVPENQGLPIQFFKVQWRELGREKINNGKSINKWMTASQDIPSYVRSFEIPELRPDHNYRFRIAAVYANNDNAVSPMQRYHLGAEIFNNTPLPVPLLLQVTPVSPSEIKLRWENTNISMAVDGFYVYYRASSSAGDYTKAVVEGRNSNNFTVTHLQPDSNYEFKVQSFSVTSASDFSQIQSGKTYKMFTQASISQISTENKPMESPKSSNMYAIIGGTMGGFILLIGLTAIGVVIKRQKSKQTRETSQAQGKSIANGRVLNGEIADSKINITSNPLAGIEPNEDSIQPKSGRHSSMEMSSFLNGQNDNPGTNLVDQNHEHHTDLCNCYSRQQQKLTNTQAVQSTSNSGCKATMVAATNSLEQPI